MVLTTIFKTLFPKKVLIYTAIGQTQYFQIVDKLITHGVKYFTKTQNDLKGRDYFRDKNRIYEIYVKVEDEGKAIEAIHNKSL